jgi:type IV secretory pathway VirJ component
MKPSRFLPALAALAPVLFAISPVRAGSAVTTTVTVKTSRGEYNLLVYAPKADAQRPPVLLLSGEGGWRHFDQMLAGYFRDAGHWVGGLDSMKYFWRAQDDRQILAADIRAYTRELVKAAGRPPGSPVILAGFSFGADLAPWIAGAGGWGDQIAGLVMLGPDQTGSLEFRVLEIFGVAQKEHIFPVSEAIASARGVPLLFVHGGNDPHSDAPPLFRAAPDPKRLLTVPDCDHHFSGQEKALRATLKEGLEWLLQAGSGGASRGKEAGP